MVAATHHAEPWLVAEREQRDERLTTWGMRLRRLREHRGLSIDELANAGNLSSRQLIRVEHGKASPSVLWILDVAAALQVEPSELFRD